MSYLQIPRVKGVRLALCIPLQNVLAIIVHVFGETICKARRIFDHRRAWFPTPARAGLRVGLMLVPHAYAWGYRLAPACAGLRFAPTLCEEREEWGNVHPVLPGVEFCRFPGPRFGTWGTRSRRVWYFHLFCVLSDARRKNRGALPRGRPGGAPVCPWLIRSRCVQPREGVTLRISRAMTMR
jgi:hypothetical protein